MIYFITARDVGMVKIGHAFKPQERFHTVQTGSPIELCLERVCEGGYKQEDELHLRFIGCHVRGEWFRITPELEQHMATLPKYVWRNRGCQHAARRAAKAA